MITNIIIFGLNVSNWIFFLAGIIAAMLYYNISWWKFDFLKSKKQKQELKKNEEENDKRKKKEELERGYFCVGDSIFFSILGKIRVTWQIHEKASSDILMISSSWPIDMSEDDLKNFQDLLPELISIKAIERHQLSFKKSPAADFSSIKEAILKYLFCHLNKKYAWLNKNAVVKFEAHKNDRPDYMHCVLEYLLLEHLPLGINLGIIDGIENKNGIRRQMLTNSHSFDIIKDEDKTWDELIPLIKSVFVNYFPKDVEFIGNYPSVEKKSQST